MDGNQNRITRGQFLFMILQTQIGVGILSLPYNVHEAAKGDGWISVLMAGLWVQLMIVIMWSLNRRFPSLTLYDILPHLIGKWPAKILISAYIFSFIVIIIIVLVLFAGIIQGWMMTETPRWVITGFMAATAAYLTISPLKLIGRFYTFVSGLSGLIILIAILAYFDPFTEINVHYIYPLGQIAGPINLLKGANESTFALTGFEIMMVLYPFAEGSASDKLKAASLANLITTLVYIFMTVTALMIFSPVEMTLIPEPTIYMLKAFRFQLVERPDLYFISLWIFLAFTSTVSDLFVASLGMARLFNQQSHQKWVFWVALIGYVVSLIPKDQFDVESIDKVEQVLFYILIVGMPPVLLAISLLRGKKERREGGQTDLSI
ncbi:GerAB/ArcD/ProY family transporter [Desmospora profundinema]|uniref:Spore germination protein (Amino acid permease) n=1 Tax=Desmospora profundinema TaxID=1571184 RepID=A0ABU1II29_9BACL|nr:GerAB/ArcD/ProY family transporter [Desmospora profundinema]MDR6224346.1 spore germination protein (amino acid permease) [Desmospora profundinema]